MAAAQSGAGSDSTIKAGHATDQPIEWQWAEFQHFSRP
jgi:hypothetical protein